MKSLFDLLIMHAVFSFESSTVQRTDRRRNWMHTKERFVVALGLNRQWLKLCAHLEWQSVYFTINRKAAVIVTRLHRFSLLCCNFSWRNAIIQMIPTLINSKQTSGNNRLEFDFSIFIRTKRRCDWRWNSHLRLGKNNICVDFGESKKKESFNERGAWMLTSNRTMRWFFSGAKKEAFERFEPAAWRWFAVSERGRGNEQLSAMIATILCDVKWKKEESSVNRETKRCQKVFFVICLRRTWEINSTGNRRGCRQIELVEKSICLKSLNENFRNSLNNWVIMWMLSPYSSAGCCEVILRKSLLRNKMEIELMSSVLRLMCLFDLRCALNAINFI